MDRARCPDIVRAEPFVRKSVQMSEIIKELLSPIVVGPLHQFFHEGDVLFAAGKVPTWRDLDVGRSSKAASDFAVCDPHRGGAIVPRNTSGVRQSVSGKPTLADVFVMSHSQVETSATKPQKD